MFSLIVWANFDYFYTVFRLLVRVTLCIVFRTFIWNFRGFKFRLDCFFLELFGFQVWSTRQPPQTPPKRREWILHRKRRKRNFEHFVLSNMNLPTISIVTGSIFWGLRVGFLGIWGGMQLPVDRRGQSGWLFLLAVVCWTFLSLTCTVLGLLKYPWRLRNYFLNIPPKVKFSRQVKFQFRISGQAVGEETRTRNFPSHALMEIIYFCEESGGSVLLSSGGLNSWFCRIRKWTLFKGR